MNRNSSLQPWETHTAELNMSSILSLFVAETAFLVLYWIQSFSPVRELRADQVLSLGSLVTEMGERELHDTTSLTNLGVLAHLGTLTDWSSKKVNFWTFHPGVKHPEGFNTPISACLMFLFFFSDESSDFRCDAETQTESGAVNSCWSGNIWPSDLWSVSLRDETTEPLQPQVSQIPNCIYPASSHTTTFNNSCKSYYNTGHNSVM